MAEDIRYYGQWMRDEAEKRIGHLYPKVKAWREPRTGRYFDDARVRRWKGIENSEQESAEKAEVKSIARECGYASISSLLSSISCDHLTVIAWLWARTVASPNPAAKGAHVPLVRSFWLSTKTGKKAWVEVEKVENSGQEIASTAHGPSSFKDGYRFIIRTGNGEPRAGTVSRNGGVCLLTGSPMPLEYVRAEGKAGRLGARLMAIVAEGPHGRIYLPPSDEHERIAKCAQPHDVPDTDLVVNSRYMTPTGYGMTKHRHLFTNRQLVALTTFCDLVAEARARVLHDAGSAGIPAGAVQAHADAVVTYLGFALSKLSDSCNALVSWKPSMTQVIHLFTRQAIPIVWDFAEPNAFSESAGDYGITLGNILRIFEGLGSQAPGIVRQLSAADLAAKDGGAPRVFSTDPPYYDNVPYADLSDFFYVWLRRCLQPIYPDLLGTLLVPKAEELVADPFRHGGKEEARSFFERGMGRVFARMREASDSRFPTTIYYAFKQAEDDEADGEVEERAGKDAGAPRASTGWETFLQGLADAGWQINGTWPMRTELGNRMRNLASNALASSIVLVCRPRAKDAGVASRRDFLAALKRELPEALRNLQKGNIAPVDLAQAAIGPGMTVFSRYARVLETDGSPMGVRTALSLINQSLDEVLAEQEGEFDADTRWALAWFDQYGFTEGPYGAAETLCTAKNTSVFGMVEAGILAAKGGRVRLLGNRIQEIGGGSRPAAKSYLLSPTSSGRPAAKSYPLLSTSSVWRATHELIAALDQGEQAAAELLRKLGPISETARELSYRLYTVCERRKWAQNAIGYNALVLAWPDLTRLAQEQKAAGPRQGELI